VLIFLFVVVAVVVCIVFIFVCTIEVKAWWQSPRMRLFRLGGVTTLRRKLNYSCTMCQAMF
jgi:predicted signal transduction protein with EAL and GGDEF domain